MNTQNNFNIVVLGSGTSTGVPIIGCHCQVCKSPRSENKRYRTSILIETPCGSHILVDTTTDLRSQLLENKIEKIDAAVITHNHADHLHGIDDLRPLCFGSTPKVIPVYTDEFYEKDLYRRFSYIFNHQKHLPNIGGGIPRLKLEVIEAGNLTPICGQEFEFIKLPHGHIYSLGFLVNQKFAFLGDCHEVPEEVIEKLKNLDLELLLIDCVVNAPHQTHLWVERSFEYISKIRPAQAGLIHMGHHLEHFALLERAKKIFDFPVYPVYDRQRISFR